LSENSIKHMVAVIGAGPAGLFAARELANTGIDVVLINRDIKPGGLAEYGIYPEKHKMKEVLRSQFRQIMSDEQIHYYGNVTVGKQADITLEQLKRLGFQGILITAGAQGTKWLKLPGENLNGVYHAKDLVYHYNKLPPFSQKKFEIGKRVAIVGIGNVMTDIARYMIDVMHADEVTAIARRGPSEIKFDRKELEQIAGNLDITAFDQEIDRAAPLMWSLGQNPEETRSFIHSVYAKCAPAGSKTHMVVRFLLSPTRIFGDENGRVRTLEVEENTLILEDGIVKAHGTGRRRVIDTDTVIFAIGDAVDENLGLPVEKFEFVKNPNPRFKIEETTYEVLDPVSNQALDGIFIAGWSRKASAGLVGVARKDGTNGARALIQYIQTTPDLDTSPLAGFEDYLQGLGKPIVNKQDLNRLELVEYEHARTLELEEFKFSSNEEMLAVIQQPL
jgi:ferredoxin--NADP+ reductase